MEEEPAAWWEAPAWDALESREDARQRHRYVLWYLRQRGVSVEPRRGRDGRMLLGYRVSWPGSPPLAWTVNQLYAFYAGIRYAERQQRKET